MHLNILKAQQNGFVTDLKPGNKDRIDDTAIGKSVTLTDGATQRRSKVLMVPYNTVIAPITEKNVIKVATKKHKDKDKLYFKREGINEANVIQGKRRR
jgi:hypothetical protein